MAVMQNSVIFGGVDSADYGIYIGGEGVFNAPKRDVEMISIPGRNGSFALDRGRFENITVTYSAFNYEEDLATFAQNLADFRNAISAKKGYQRLTDTFHTDEYRMATFIDGLEIEPIKYNTASQFDLTFECKPQRWLTSGETAVTVASGGTVTNPTLFESGPLLAVEGYGTIEFNGHEIEIENATLGNVLLHDARTSSATGLTYVVTTTSLNTGDNIYVDEINMECSRISTVGDITSAGTITDSNPNFTTTYRFSGTTFTFITKYKPFTFQKGSAYAEDTNTVTGNYNTTQGGVSNIVIHQSVEVYDSATSIRPAVFRYSYAPIEWGTLTIGKITGVSTKSIMGHPTYIDCDLGEAYKYEGGEPVSLNAYIDLGSDLPTLASGTSTITYDNTITDLKVTPRWWKV